MYSRLCQNRCLVWIVNLPSQTTNKRKRNVTQISPLFWMHLGEAWQSWVDVCCVNESAGGFLVAALHLKFSDKTSPLFLLYASFSLWGFPHKGGSLLTILFTDDVQKAFEQMARGLHSVIMRVRCPSKQCAAAVGSRTLASSSRPFFSFLSSSGFICKHSRYKGSL